MIKIEHVVTASAEQMEFVIEGMRNPKNSWDKSDSSFINNTYFMLGGNDEKLMRTLASAGPCHRKFMRMMPVYMRITAPLYWWKEFDTYKVGTVANSCSTMHKLMDHKFTSDDFSFDEWDGSIFTNRGSDQEVISTCNYIRDCYLNTTDEEKKKKIWHTLVKYLPSAYNQTRNVMMNYEVLTAIYPMRKNHKQMEWREFCKKIEGLPFSWLITESKAANIE